MVCPCHDTAVQSVSSFRPLLHITVPCLFLSLFEISLFVPCCHNQSFSCHNRIGHPEEEVVFSDLLNVYFLAIPTHFCSQKLTLVSTPVKELPVKIVGVLSLIVLLLLSRERGWQRCCAVFFCNTTIPTGRKKMLISICKCP